MQYLMGLSFSIRSKLLNKNLLLRLVFSGKYDEKALL